MKITHLPILSADTPLRDAVKAMRVHQRIAVVRQEPTEFRLIKIARIYSALGHHLSKLSNVSLTHPIHKPTSSEISQYNLNIKTPQHTETNWQSFMDDRGHRYVLINSFLSTALIATQHEPDAEALEVIPEDCYCEGPDEHSLPPEKKVQGDRCSACSEHVYCD